MSKRIHDWSPKPLFIEKEAAQRSVLVYWAVNVSGPMKRINGPASALTKETHLREEFRLLSR
ncbi:predicted protein [Arabidopsis lyrata subsp. lyrata]|uniref:Predicted protein n=1 Tax=Arabidopsis lyrata subsp. lyrata TaxID=81972 RepID=D7MBS8_ARALL|nr:predicted protein [Arabidopsis lyrata subsp. lyrata]